MPLPETCICAAIRTSSGTVIVGKRSKKLASGQLAWRATVDENSTAKICTDTLTRAEIEAALRVCEKTNPVSVERPTMSGPELHLPNLGPEPYLPKFVIDTSLDHEFAALARTLLPRALRELLERAEDSERLDWVLRHVVWLSTRTTRADRSAIDAARKEPHAD